MKFSWVRLIKKSPPKIWSRKVRESVAESRIGYIKNLITLASGTLLLTFTIFQFFQTELTSGWMLILTWLLLACSVTSGVIAYTTIIHDDLFWKIGENILDGKAIEEYPKVKQLEIFNYFQRSIDAAAIGYYCEIIQGVAFILSFGSLTVLLVINI